MDIYFDNGATTRVFPEVKDIMVKVLEEEYGNPSSVYGAFRLVCPTICLYPLMWLLSKAWGLIHIGDWEIVFPEGEYPISSFQSNLLRLIVYKLSVKL